MKRSIQLSKIYDEAKKATLTEARALKVGDIIKAFYTDSEEPEVHLVIAQWGNSKTGQHYDFDTVPIGSFGKRSSTWSGPRSLNTDKWVRVAHGSDILQMMTLHVAQEADLSALAAGAHN
jgi:hypothetical protein